MWDILPGLHSKVAAAFQACMVCSDKQTIPNQSQRTTSKTQKSPDTPRSPEGRLNQVAQWCLTSFVAPRVDPLSFSSLSEALLAIHQKGGRIYFGGACRMICFSKLRQILT